MLLIPIKLTILICAKSLMTQCHFDVVPLPSFLLQSEKNIIRKPWGFEEWLFSAHPSSLSYLRVGERVVSMVELFKEAREELCGKAAEFEEFPILVKVLDVRDRLSVQVHPSDEIAEELGEVDGRKMEGFLMLGRGVVYAGFREDVKPGVEVVGKLHRFEAGFLDTFLIKPGVAHYVEGARFLEVSTNSNITYRVYDFSGRVVEPEKAMKAMRFEKSRREDIKRERRRLLTDCFSFEAVEGGRLQVFLEAFNIVFSAKGKVALRREEDEAVLGEGEACLVPAATGVYELLVEEGVAVRIWP
ncbi:Phosphomannose isomerase type I [Candidatus Methanoperedenaceae archaeon GB50]|nr:Phosphomannose isomerase type I [Candidatus Methanoperedenaceae archaeon GB50]